MFEVHGTGIFTLHRAVIGLKNLSVNKSKELTRKRKEEFERRGVPFAPLTRPTEFACQSEEEYEKFCAKADPRDVDD